MFIVMGLWFGSQPLVSGILIITGSSLELLWDILWLTQVLEILQVLFHQSLQELQQVLDGIDVRVGQPQAWLWAEW